MSKPDTVKAQQTLPLIHVSRGRAYSSKELLNSSTVQYIQMIAKSMGVELETSRCESIAQDPALWADYSVWQASTTHPRTVYMLQGTHQQVYTLLLVTDSLELILANILRYRYSNVWSVSKGKGDWLCITQSRVDGDAVCTFSCQELHDSYCK